MKLRMFLLLVTLTMPAFGQKAPLPSDFSTGAGLQRACATVLDLNVYHPRKVKKHREAFEVGYCLGVVHGTYQNLNGESDFCPGENAPLRLVLENVVAFMKQHPELKDKDAPDVVRWTLAEYFPCPAKPDSNEPPEVAKNR